jgi:hypothetical protein
LKKSANSQPQDNSEMSQDLPADLAEDDEIDWGPDGNPRVPVPVVIDPKTGGVGASSSGSPCDEEPEEEGEEIVSTPPAGPTPASLVDSALVDEIGVPMQSESALAMVAK